MTLHRTLGRAEDMLSACIERVRYLRRTQQASSWLRSKADLRGDRCHCDPSIAPHYVHSEGLRESADIVLDYGSNVSSPARLQAPPEAAARIAPEMTAGDVVHVKTDLLPAFERSFLPHVREPVVLVTGDSDIAPVAQFAHLLHHPKIARWFAQNADVAGHRERLARIPIGVDNPVYTKLEKRIGFLADIVAGRSAFDMTLSRNDMGDQRALGQIASSCAANIGQRPLRVLCTFHQNHKIAPDISDIPARTEAFAALSGKEICHFVGSRLPQKECWRLHSEFAFEASPHGNGLDCFRTWEALALGTIPIVKKSTLDELYRDNDFPVVIVESWDEVTAANLATWHREFTPLFGSLAPKLTNQFWVDRIRSASDAVRTGIAA